MYGTKTECTGVMQLYTYTDTITYRAGSWEIIASHNLGNTGQGTEYLWYRISKQQKHTTASNSQS